MSMQTEERRYRQGDEPVPGFRLVKFLGAGAYGEVWKAISAGGVDVALKILYKIDRQKGRKAFRGLQRVKNINNPHLVSVFAFWLKDEYGNILDDEVGREFADESSDIMSSKSTDKVSDTLTPEELEGDIRESPGAGFRPAELIICMQLANETMSDCLERYQKAGEKGIPREELLRYIEGTAKGLDYLNVQHKICHGDVKPQNLMISGGEGQVSDFDLAKNLGDPRETSFLGGTIAYAAPEVMKAKKIAATSDQYALAISYFELRTGRLPYADEDINVVITAKITGDLDLSALPKSERKLIAKATALDPAKRYRNSIDFVEALKVGEKPGPLRYLKWAAALLLLLTIFLGAWWKYVPAPYDLGTVVGYVYGYQELRNQQIVEALSAVDESTSAESCRDRLRDATLFIRTELTSEPSAKLKREYSRVVGRFLDRSAEQLDTPEIAKNHYSNAMEFLGDTYLGEDQRTLENPIAEMVGNRSYLLFRATLGQARATLLISETADDGESFQRDWQQVEKLQSAAASLEDELSSQDELQLAVVRCLTAERVTNDPLSKQTLEPLAQVKTQLTDAPLATTLTADERRRITALAQRVDDQYLKRLDTLPQDHYSHPLVAKITGGNSQLYWLTHRARNLLLRWKQEREQADLVAAEEQLQRAKQVPPVAGTPIEAQIRRLDTIVGLLLRLRDDTRSARDLVDQLAQVISSEEVVLLELKYPLYEALLDRAERESLNPNPSLSRNGLLTSDDVSRVISMAEEDAGRLTKEQLRIVRARAAGLRAVAAIDNPDPPYEQLSALCDEYLSWHGAEKPSDVAHVIRILRAECQLVLAPPDDLTPPWEESERAGWDNALVELSQGTEKFREYATVGRAYFASEMDSAKDLADSMQRLMTSLRTPGVVRLLNVRPARKSLVAKSIMRAAWAQRDKTAGESAERRLLQSPFCEGGARHASQFLKYCGDELGQPLSPEAKGLFAEAAFFQEPPDGPDYALAATITDELLAAANGTPELWLINAYAHEQIGDRGPKQLATILRSYAHFLETCFNQDASPTDGSQLEDIWKLGVERASRVMASSPYWQTLRDAILQSPSHATTLSEEDQQLCRHGAAVLAGKAQLLQEAPTIEQEAPDMAQQKQEILQLFKTAMALAPEKVEYILEVAMAYLDIPDEPTAQLNYLRELAERAKLADQDHAGHFVLQGRCAIMQAMFTEATEDKVTTLRTARQNLTTACERAESDQLLLWNALVAKADAEVQLANALHSQNEQGAEISELLHAANEAADAALKLNRHLGPTRLVKGNALEDEGLLLHQYEAYRAALQVFADAFKAAADDREGLVEARARLGFGRTLYRLLRDTGQTDVPPVEAVADLPAMDLQLATEQIREAGQIVGIDAATLSDTHLYQALICELIARRPETSLEQRLQQLDQADQHYTRCVEQSRRAGLPEAGLWQLYRVKNAYNRLRFSGIETYEKQLTALLELSDALRHSVVARDSNSSADLSRLDGDILLANVKIISDVPDLRGELSTRVDELLQLPLALDIKAHMLLLRGQYLFDAACEMTRLDTETWQASRTAINRDLDSVDRLLGNDHFPNAPLWRARLAGQRALCQWKTSEIATGAEKKSTGLAACAALLQAIGKYSDLGAPYRGEAICLRYKLGELTVDLLRNKDVRDSVDSALFLKTKTDALSAINEIHQVDWEARQKQIRSYQLPATLWDWRFRERFEVISDDNGYDAPYRRVTDLKKDILELN